MPGPVDHVSVFFVKGALAFDEVVFEGSYELLASDELDHSFAISEVALELSFKIQPVVIDVMEIHVVDVFTGHFVLGYLVVHSACAVELVL